MAQARSIAAIVGLGNPGPKYERTRHNVGFWFVDRLAERARVAFRNESKFHGELARAAIDGHDIRLLKPMTYMNRSGQAVAALLRFFKLQPSAVWVAHDDVDLPAGTVRIKDGGGHGGHNGLRDLVGALGTRDFLRLRIGVGHPGSSDQVVPYVLSKPGADERRLIDAAIDEALDVVGLVLGGELDKAMQRLHTRKDAS